MKNLLDDWIGQTVHVTLRATVPTPMEGILAATEESGVMLDMPDGRTFVPVTSIMHVSRMAQ